MKKKTTPKSTTAKKSKSAVKDEKANELDVTPFDAEDRPDHISEEDVDVPTESGTFHPTVKLLQNLSPELDEDEEKYIELASVGDIVVTDGDTVVLIDGKIGLKFIPIHTRKQWVEWVPRKKGGGFVASYSSKEEMEAEFSSGNEVQVSIDYLCLSSDIDPDGELQPLVIQFNSPTKMGVARTMANFIREYKTMYGIQYTIRSKKMKNKAGQKFFNFVIEPVGWVNRDLFVKLENATEEYEQWLLPQSTGNGNDDDDDV